VWTCDGRVVLRQSELVNGTELMNDTYLIYNGSQLALTDNIGLEPHEVLCAPPVTNKMWRMASGYIGAALMLVMAVYGRYSIVAFVAKSLMSHFCSFSIHTVLQSANRLQ